MAGGDGRLKYEYDESGTTFLFFATTLIGLFLVPYTLRWLVGLITRKSEPAAPTRKTSRRPSNGTIIFCVIWVIFGLMAYNLSQAQFETDLRFNPYTELQLEEGASKAEIRAAYRALSLQWHPDKNKGNEEEANRRFVILAKAYKILTNEDALAEWEQHGDTDARSISAGVALPSALTSGHNSKLLLLAYMTFLVLVVVFMWRWWKRNRNLLDDDVLQQNVDTYRYYLWKDFYRPALNNNRPLHIIHNDMIEILYKSPEFIEGVKERETDGEIEAAIEIAKGFVRPPKNLRPHLRKVLLHLYAQTHRLTLVPADYEEEHTFVVQQSLKLLRRLAQLGVMEGALHDFGRREFPKSKLPFQPLADLSLRAIESSQMIAQGVWTLHNLDAASFQQLPHFDAALLAKINKGRKKEALRSIRSLLTLGETERNELLAANLNKEQCADVQAVIARIPVLQHKRIVVTPSVVRFGSVCTITVSYYVRLGGLTDEQAAAETTFLAKRAAAAAAAGKKAAASGKKKGRGSTPAPADAAPEAAEDAADESDFSDAEETAGKSTPELLRVPAYDMPDREHTFVMLLFGPEGRFVHDIKEARLLTRSGDDSALMLKAAFHVNTPPVLAEGDIEYKLHIKSDTLLGSDIVETVRVHYFPTLVGPDGKIANEAAEQPIEEVEEVEEDVKEDESVQN